MPTTLITNIAAYKFAALSDLKSLRENLIVKCKSWGLKGTILLSTEGINLFIAGPQPSIELLLAELRKIPGLEDLTPKYSDSEEQPFTRMLVRIKKEIISFGVEGIDPARRTSPKLKAHELKQWLDEGRPVTLLDTRNDYEVKMGTFKGAVTFDIDHFRQFPEAVRQLPVSMKKEPIVMFCTGGIRCEKAGPFMEMEGFEQIYQLDGGILKYFEEVGQAHYDGECFVFDQRVGVDPSLRETESAICYACQTPLTAQEQEDSRFIPGVSCPFCFKTSDDVMKLNITRRHEAIRAATHPLPGCEPYENRRPLNIPSDFDGHRLLDFLVAVFPHIERDEWLQRCQNGRFLNDQGAVIPADYRLRAGERCIQIIPGTVEPPVNADIRIVHEDEMLFVVQKPAPLPMHPSGRFNRNTLQHILCEVYAPQRPKFVHRLDANTTGLVLCARTRHFAKLLQQQFKQHRVEKVYLVRVLGHPAEDTFRCEAPISTEPGSLGSHAVDEDEGQDALTEFTVERRELDGTAVLQARPVTGRTNQIRVHLWHLGIPVCGDPAYLPDQKLGDTQTLATESGPLQLHAWRLAFDHPLTQKRMVFETERPSWA